MCKQLRTASAPKSIAAWKLAGGGAQGCFDVPFVIYQIGDYQIIREIGRGGKGVVYEAEQESLSRRVALEEQSVAMLLRSDGGMRLWLNSQLVFEQVRARRASMGQDVVAVMLQSGWNTLMVKVANSTGPMGFYLQFSDHAR